MGGASQTPAGTEGPLVVGVTVVCTESAEAEWAEPHSHRPAQKDRVYTVATDHTIRSVMAEYRRRKQTHLLPRTSPATTGTGAGGRTRSGRKKDSRDLSRSLKVTDAVSTSADPVERQIVEQERASIMKVKNS